MTETQWIIPDIRLGINLNRSSGNKPLCHISMTIDMSLNNAALYEGCAIEEVAGRLNLTTPTLEAIAIVGRNANKLVNATSKEERGEVVLTGPMAIWAYLVVGFAVVHVFAKVQYGDARGAYLVAAHGA